MMQRDRAVQLRNDRSCWPWQWWQWLQQRRPWWFRRCDWSATRRTPTLPHYINTRHSQRVNCERSLQRIFHFLLGVNKWFDTQLHLISLHKWTDMSRVKEVWSLDRLAFNESWVETVEFLHCQWDSCKGFLFCDWLADGRVWICCHSRVTTRASVWFDSLQSKPEARTTHTMFDQFCLLQPHTRWSLVRVTMFLSPSRESDETQLPPSLGRESDKPQVPIWTRTTISPHLKSCCQEDRISELPITEHGIGHGTHCEIHTAQLVSFPCLTWI